MITDSDMIAHPDLVETHLSAHEKSTGPMCYEGVTMNMTHLHWPINDDYLYPYITKEYSDGDALGWYYFLTGNISFPKSVFDAENGFDETFQSYGWEDIELGYRLSKKGVPLRFLKMRLIIITTWYPSKKKLTDVIKKVNPLNCFWPSTQN